MLDFDTPSLKIAAMVSSFIFYHVENSWIRLAQPQTFDRQVCETALIPCLSLNLLEHLRPLLPIIHDDLGVALLRQSLGHLIHLLLAFLDVVDADVRDAGNTSTHGGSGAGFGVLDGDALLWLDAELFAGVEVDGWIGLGGWWVEGGGGGVDVFVLEEACRRVLV